MLRGIKQLYGNKLDSVDGEIGHIEDFYFDEMNWVVRYAIVKTGSWLSGKLVFIAPDAFTSFDCDGGFQSVNLTKEQIESCPDSDSKAPVSMPHEEEYFRHSAWPGSWSGNGIGGTCGFPLVASPPTVSQVQRSKIPVIHAVSNLRSTKAVKNYLVETKDGPIGYVIDFIVDHKTWSICHIVVETGPWYSHKEIVISPRQVENISYEQSTVFLTLSVSKVSLQKSPEYQVPACAFTQKESATTELGRLQ